MARADEAELGEDFSYIIRIADTDMDGLKKMQTALTSIRGIGIRTAALICDKSGLDRNQLAGHLSSDELEVLRGIIDSYSQTAPLWMLNRQRDPETGEYFHLFGQDAKLVQEDDISRLRAIKAYRGVRHATGNKVRGQRGRSNGRRGLSLGVHRK
jgi:small subunit ribosomal protein S13